MPKANCTFRRNDVKRACAAVIDAGMKVAKIVFEPNGKFTLIAANDTGEKPEAGHDLDRELAEFEARRD